MLIHFDAPISFKGLATRRCFVFLQPDPLATNPDFDPVLIAPVIAELGAAPKCASY